jgi:hypothetical protein
MPRMPRMPTPRETVRKEMQTVAGKKLRFVEFDHKQFDDAWEAACEAIQQAGHLADEKEEARLHRYAILKRRELDLLMKRMLLEIPDEGFTRDSQADRAGAAATAYRDINRLRRELQLPEMERPEDVRRADSMRMAYSRAIRSDRPIPVASTSRPD